MDQRAIGDLPTDPEPWGEPDPVVFDFAGLTIEALVWEPSAAEDAGGKVEIVRVLDRGDVLLTDEWRRLIGRVMRHVERAARAAAR